MTTGKTIALTRQAFVGKVMSLLFNKLSRLVIAFLPRSKCLLISWLQSPSAVILEPKKIKSVTVSTVSPSICHEVMGPDAMILVFWTLNFKPTFSLSFYTFIKRLFSSSLLSAIRVVSSVFPWSVPDSGERKYLSFMPGKREQELSIAESEYLPLCVHIPAVMPPNSTQEQQLMLFPRDFRKKPDSHLFIGLKLEK